jgi:23S rRNA (adenine1618-N6)-methyltransferase
MPLQKVFYGVSWWEFPDGYLTPPVPSRADYVHRVAELLHYAKGDDVRVLDVGVGANCIFPLIGRAEYGWSFVGSDIDSVALESARRIADSNPALMDRPTALELRRQTERDKTLEGIVQAHEQFDAVMCNPPFHATLAVASAGSRRKWRNLGYGNSESKNFGGQARELWCPGGEAAFVCRMIEEGARHVGIRWFTALLSKEQSLSTIDAALRKAAVTKHRVIPMEQGQKKSRIVAWSFQ